jgi:putative ABC transport system ATP-binding protein
VTPVLEAREIVVLREGRRILDGASILVRPGEAVAIQGPSGSGKSTLARTLATLVEADAGTILLDGQDAHEIAPTQFRTRVAFLAQQPAMFAGTVRDNLGAGPALHGKSLGAAQARELILAVGLDESILPREARTLSGGEKQRVALGRALANAPDVLLLDEPTAALDPEAGERIVALLRAL